MAIKKTKRQKQAAPKTSRQQRIMQILLALFAIVLILSMVLTAIAKY
jgi:uncharacterized membrane protein